MQTLQENKTYPYFLGPSDHGLAVHYKILNRIWVVFFVIIFLVNEVKIRPNAEIYKQSPESVWSIIAQILNAEILMINNMLIIGVIGLTIILARINFYFLPKWAPRTVKFGLRTGLPDLSELPTAHFKISSLLEEFSFNLWNFFTMPVLYINPVLSTFICLFNHFHDNKNHKG